MLSFLRSICIYWLTALPLLIAPSLVHSEATISAEPLAKSLKAAGRVLIINGEEADPNDYPVTFLSGASPTEMCTWFLVSPRALIGAAHCIGAPGGANFTDRIEVKAGSKTYSGTCETPDSYPLDKSQDWAACLLNHPYELEASPDIPVSGFEVLNIDAARIVQGVKVEIGGFGCVVPSGPVVKHYQIGFARVTQVPPNALVSGSITQTPNAISIRQSPSIICEGDSGGPAFIYQKPGRVMRVVVGVNSSTVVQAGMGYLASTSTKAAIKFFQEWSTKNGELLCGIHKSASGCRPFLKHNP